MRISDWSSDVCSSDLADKFVPFGSACRRCLVVLVVIHGEEPLSVALRDLKFLSHLLVHALKDEDRSSRVDHRACAARIVGARLAAIGLADVMRETDRGARLLRDTHPFLDRKSTRLNSSHSCAPRM